MSTANNALMIAVVYGLYKFAEWKIVHKSQSTTRGNQETSGLQGKQIIKESVIVFLCGLLGMFLSEHMSYSMAAIKLTRSDNLLQGGGGSVKVFTDSPGF